MPSSGNILYCWEELAKWQHTDFISYTYQHLKLLQWKCFPQQTHYILVENWQEIPSVNIFWELASFSLTHGKHFLGFDKSYLWLPLKTICNYLARNVAVCCWQEFCLLPNPHSRAQWSPWGSSSPEPGYVLNLFQCAGIKSHIPLYF